MEKIETIRKYLEENNLDGILYTSPENVFYMSGFSGYGDGTLIITKTQQMILTDFRYNSQVIEECPEFTHINQNCDDMAATAALIKKNGLKRVGFENERISYAMFTELTGESPDVAYVGIDDITETLRTVKNEYELSCIEKACKISSEAFAEMYDEIKIGMSEREAAALLEYNMRKHGADGIAFETIVASGLRGAMCHGTATDKKLQEGDAVTVDFGAKYRGYDADMTRTFFMGSVSDKMAEIYEIVRTAQQLALDGFKEGMTGGELDGIARKYIESKGYGEYFGHGTGHGVGIMIHELPRVSRRRTDILSEGMVFSVEPGIYIPDLGGVRIEDLVSVQNGKLKVMTSFEKGICVRK